MIRSAGETSTQAVSATPRLHQPSSSNARIWAYPSAACSSSSDAASRRLSPTIAAATGHPRRGATPRPRPVSAGSHGPTVPIGEANP